MGSSTLDAVFAAAVHDQGRIVVADLEPEKGHFYRADHFAFAKAGVPSLYTKGGKDYIGKPADFGKRMSEEYTSQRYHKVTDVVQPGWDLRGAVQDVRLLFETGYAVAQSDALPQWLPAAEFKAKRDAMMQGAH